MHGNLTHTANLWQDRVRCWQQTRATKPGLHVCPGAAQEHHQYDLHFHHTLQPQVRVEPGVHGPPVEKVGQSRGQGSLPGSKFKVKPADHQGGLLPYPHSS